MELVGIVTPEDLSTILALLSVTERALKLTLQQKKYPLLSGHRIACLDGKHRLRALTQNRPLSWWVVRLYCVQGSWLWESRQVLQDQVEYTSHEIPYSDAEIYQLVRHHSEPRDVLNAFFDKTSDLSNLGGEQCPMVPTMQHVPGEDKSLSDSEDIYSATDREGDVEVHETGRDAPTGAMDKEETIKQKSMINVLRPRSGRIVKGRRKSRASEDVDQSVPIDEDTYDTSTNGDDQDLEDGVTSIEREIELRTLREPEVARPDPPAASMLSSLSASSPEPVLRSFFPARAPADTSIHSRAFSEYGTSASLDPPAETSLAGPSTLREPQLARPPQRTTSLFASRK
ncbi:hypothetical protein H9Q74_012002 [Fusarium xylarioides]|nr:hypothetical protein H9Q71_011009 [Fusarium xylarioides]KAG5814858.1 hypothetical protein H9Q74_012002 [Fusarium xylarioides]